VIDECVGKTELACQHIEGAAHGARLGVYGKVGRGLELHALLLGLCRCDHAVEVGQTRRKYKKAPLTS
jgi:hypothetical protein